ncbi:hypothetical protein KKF05_03555 [Patescibacteria group bacterium]|nr:hypothetical protein [Patescibacteria group bacterium]MBU1028803.1 hypothetical protein [Patescibacteria group bacterium]MBU1915834.1 hypothetical protein [Patescibacteria group bacterium]
MNLNKTRLTGTGFANALGVFLYTLAVSWLLMNGQELFGGGEDSVLQPLAMLMLLVLSVAMVGLLIFGWPVVLYLQGHKKEAIWLTLSTLVALFLLTALALGLNILL